jgi:hypothetical protein
MTLSKILSTEPLPIPPHGQGPLVEKYNRDLHAYLLRLMAKFTPDNIVNTIIETLINNPSFVGSTSGFRVGGARIENYHPTFFGSSWFYDLSGTPTRPGITPDSHLTQSLEWDGCFPNQVDQIFYADIDRSNGAPPADLTRLRKIHTATGQFTNLHSGLTRIARSGDDWFVYITPWLDSDVSHAYAHSVVYKKTTSGARHPPPWGVYTLEPSGGSPSTSTKFEGVGNTFPSTLNILPY